MFELKTVAQRPDGCFGVLLCEGRPFAVTCERTFENLRTVIGNGKFRCTRSRYHRGGYETFEIHVAGHSRVLFHRGNKETDSAACVLVAESFAVMEGDTAIADSRRGFDEFMVLATGHREFDLIVSGR